MSRYPKQGAAGEVKLPTNRLSDLPGRADFLIGSVTLFDRRGRPSSKEGIGPLFRFVHTLQHLRQAERLKPSGQLHDDVLLALVHITHHAVLAVAGKPHFSKTRARLLIDREQIWRVVAALTGRQKQRARRQQ